MRIAFLTGHAPDAPRKTGFYFWSEILTRQNYDVEWVTLGFSRITAFGKNKRRYKGPYNRWVRLNEHLRKFSWCPPFHPVNLGHPIFNALAAPLFRLYPFMAPKALKKNLKQADIVIVESGLGLMLVPLLRSLAPQARLIYTVSDRLETLHFHPVILAAEQKAVSSFAKIRIPAQIMAQDYPALAPVDYIPQGIDKPAFDVQSPSPYQQQERNVISVGDMLFDAASIEVMAGAFPDWHFHLFGRKAQLTKNFSNVTAYGEVPFETLIPYMQHADIGLAPYRAEENAAYLCQSSLKLQQYTYCRLPVVGPSMIRTGQAHIHGYDPADPESVIAAFTKARKTERAEIDISTVLSWEEVLQRMLS